MALKVRENVSVLMDAELMFADVTQNSLSSIPIPSNAFFPQACFENLHVGFQFVLGLSVESFPQLHKSSSEGSREKVHFTCNISRRTSSTCAYAVIRRVGSVYIHAVHRSFPKQIYLYGRNQQLGSPL